MLIYAWGSGAKKSSDPMVALASFEAVEAGLKELFEITYDKIFKGIKGWISRLEILWSSSKLCDSRPTLLYALNHII